MFNLETLILDVFDLLGLLSCIYFFRSQLTLIPTKHSNPFFLRQLCTNGKCINRETGDEVINGGWGNWVQGECQDYRGKCKRWESRECNNPALVMRDKQNYITCIVKYIELL